MVCRLVYVHLLTTQHTTIEYSGHGMKNKSGIQCLCMYLIASLRNEFCSIPNRFERLSHLGHVLETDTEEHSAVRVLSTHCAISC